MFKKFVLAVALCATALLSHANNPIRTTGVGVSVEQARNDAFRKAIEIQIGTVIVSNFETSKHDIVRNEILAYSSGYVENFRIISMNQYGNRIQVEVDVWVATSKIANRILSSGDGNKNLNGSIINEQANTFLDTKQRGDELLKTTFLKYPQMAFNVNVHKYEFMHDPQRNVFLNLNVTINYNDNWLNALRETLTHIADENRGHRPDAVVMFLDYPTAFLENRKWNYWVFNETVILNEMRKHFEFKQPVLRVQMMSGSTSVQTDCFSFSKGVFYNYETHRGGVPATKIFPKGQIKDNLQFYIRNIAALNNVTEVKVDVIKTMDCK